MFSPFEIPGSQVNEPPGMRELQITTKCCSPYFFFGFGFATAFFAGFGFGFGIGFFMVALTSFRIGLKHCIVILRSFQHCQHLPETGLESTGKEFQESDKQCKWDCKETHGGDPDHVDSG
jgi:hypothetical protein